MTTAPPDHNRPTDVLILGGGLAGGLAALALHQRRPELKLRLIEGGKRLGGNHLWSFFDSDVDEADRALVAPLITAGWTRYDVAFPDHARTLDQRYYSIESERFDAHLRATLPPGTVVTGAVARDVSPDGATLASGERMEAAAVLDARGLGRADAQALNGGWQKFVGLHLELDEPHGLNRPIVMDATVPQLDGYRFVYVLPMGPTTVFVEDTYYADGPDLDAAALRRRLGRYADERGWKVKRVLREETGVLPVVTGGSFDQVVGRRRRGQAGRARRLLPSADQLFAARRGAHRQLDRGASRCHRPRRCTTACAPARRRIGGAAAITGCCHTCCSTPPSQPSAGGCWTTSTAWTRRWSRASTPGARRSPTSCASWPASPPCLSPEPWRRSPVA